MTLLRHVRITRAYFAAGLQHLIEEEYAAGIGDPLRFPMPSGDPALMAALQHRMGGDEGALFEDPNFVGEGVHFDDPLPGRVRNAVKIAIFGFVLPNRNCNYYELLCNA